MFDYHDYVKTDKEFRMNQEFICTIGIPGCGKSGWAKDYMRASKDAVAIIERDIIRAGYHTTTKNLWDYRYGKAKEQAVTAQQEADIRFHLGCGHSVIVSDTNLNEGTRNRMEAIAAEYSLAVRYEVFDVPLYKAMKWNAKRPNHVPESVMIRMERKMRQYLGKYVQQDRHDRKERMLPSCVIMDIDGTLADMKGIRGPFDWDKVGEDKVIEHVVSYARFLYTQSKHNLFLFSGRDGSCRELTEAWLEEHSIYHDGLFMREAGSTENDSVIKERLFDEHIKGVYSVDHIVDDRAQVCKHWESMGFRVMNVGGFLADF
jgi:predicted kinase